MADHYENHTGHERILVCFSPSPSSARVIRVAADTAASRKMRLVALHLENPRSGPAKGDARIALERNRKLAEKLGAEIVIIRGTDLVEEILSYARLHNIQKIVI